MAGQQVVVGTRPHISLGAVTATGAGGALDNEFSRKCHAIQTVVTGGPATVSVTLEGSLNGTSWSILATSTSTTGDTQYAVDKPARWIRANLGTLTGGTAPTVTAYLVSI